jgi:DNA-binding FadR family transcriptional regulator
MPAGSVVQITSELRAARPGAVHLADSAVEGAVQEIKSLIDRRNLGVGDALPSERELCEMFALSRTTVREAMRILKTYGVVEVRPKVGAIIIDRRMDAVFDLYSFNTLELSRQTFLDTQGFRRLIEVGGMDALFERVTPANIAELRDINDAMAAEGTLSRGATHDYRLHATLVALIGNRQIDDVYRFMKPVMLKIMENGVNIRKFSGIIREEHAAIIDALEARDRFAYQYHVNRHLEAGLSLFKENGEPVGPGEPGMALPTGRVEGGRTARPRGG